MKVEELGPTYKIAFVPRDSFTADMRKHWDNGWSAVEFTPHYAANLVGQGLSGYYVVFNYDQLRKVPQEDKR